MYNVGSWTVAKEGNGDFRCANFPKVQFIVLFSFW